MKWFWWLRMLKLDLIHSTNELVGLISWLFCAKHEPMFLKVDRRKLGHKLVFLGVSCIHANEKAQVMLFIYIFIKNIYLMNAEIRVSEMEANVAASLNSEDASLRSGAWPSTWCFGWSLQNIYAHVSTPLLRNPQPPQPSVWPPSPATRDGSKSGLGRMIQNLYRFC